MGQQQSSVNQMTICFVLVWHSFYMQVFILIIFLHLISSISFWYKLVIVQGHGVLQH